MAPHTVRTTHIQRLIRNALELAQSLDGARTGPAEHAPGQNWKVSVPADQHGNFKAVPPEHALQKAAADLRHAAEELEAERLSVLGWPQV